MNRVAEKSKAGDFRRNGTNMTRTTVDHASIVKRKNRHHREP
jgi:hypothetical protein